jgi:hypothetical protein
VDTNSVPVSAAAFHAIDCDFDSEAWDRGETRDLLASGIGGVVLNRLPAHTALLSPALETDAPVTRAVIAAPDGADRAALESLHDQGVRGIRFQFGHADLADALRCAEHVVPLGWHIEFDLSGVGSIAPLVTAEWTLMQFPQAVCLTGLGAAISPEQPDPAAVEFMQALVHTGRTWIKLTGADLALAPAVLAVRKDRLLWGSGTKDPCGKNSAGSSAQPRQAGVKAALQHLADAIPDPDDRATVLVHNPACLYDFH